MTLHAEMLLYSMRGSTTHALMCCENTFDLLSGMCERERQRESEWEGAYNVQSVSTLCVNVFHAARGYLLISHARLSISAIATPQRSIYRPPTIAIAVRFFLSNDLFGPLYLEIIGSNKLLFIIDLASHRIVPFPFHCELNCPRNPLPLSHVLLAIAYLLSCYLLSVFTLHWSTFNFTAERSSQRRLKGSLLSWFCTIWIMIQLNFNQKSMNCQFHAHTLAHTYTHAYLAYVTLCLSHMWHSLRVCRNQKLCFTCPQKVCNAKSKLQAV